MRRARERARLLCPPILALLSLAGCTCEAPPDEPPLPTPIVEPIEPIEAAPEPPPAHVDPPAADGVDVPSTLVRRLRDVTDAPSGRLDATECARGCALVSPDDELLVVSLRRPAGSVVPRAIDVVRARGASHTARVIEVPQPIEAIDEGAPPPWAPLVARAVGDLSTARRARDLVSARASNSYGVEELAPLVALSGTLEARWLFVEIGETSYRLHLLRADRSVDRLLATLPLVPTACDPDVGDRACVAPLSIEAAYASRDGRLLHVLLRQPAIADGTDSTTLLTLPLDDASALPTAITEASRSADLARSIETGLLASPWRVESAPLVACERGCVRFFESGAPWIVRPERIERGVASVLWLVTPDGTSSELFRGGADAPEARARVIEHALEGAPLGEARALVLHRAIASWRGMSRVPLVALGVPHVGVRLAIELEDREYVIVRPTADGPVEVARVPCLSLDGEPSPPSLLEVYAPISAGFPLVVVGHAPTRAPGHAEGIAHGTFHAVIERGP